MDRRSFLSQAAAAGAAVAIGVESIVWAAAARGVAQPVSNLTPAITQFSSTPGST